MSTTSLPSYRPADSLHRTPSYTYEPQDDERRLALGSRTVPRPSGNFVKQSRNGNASLRLLAQAEDVTLPVYGSGSPIEGLVELSKTDGVTRVEVKLEGTLKLREIAEGGHSTARLCLDTRVLWVKDRDNLICPNTLRFSLRLPDTFTYEELTYALPPTYDVKLSGLPGFTANIDYSVSAFINRPNASGPVKSKAMTLIAGTTNVTTPIIYHPRTQPPCPLPLPLLTGSLGFLATNEWALFESTIAARGKGVQDIKTKLYIPASRTFSLTEPVPFHLLLCSNPISLAAFLPLSPALNTLGRPKAMRLQVMRQATVDVRNVVKTGVKREMWRVDCIGEGNFRLVADAPSWIAYSGEIPLSESVKNSGFKAAGLTVKDCILFTLNPPDPLKCPFSDLRQVVGVRIATDPCVQGEGSHRPSSTYSSSSS